MRSFFEIKTVFAIVIVGVAFSMHAAPQENMVSEIKDSKNEERAAFQLIINDEWIEDKKEVSKLFKTFLNNFETEEKK